MYDLRCTKYDVNTRTVILKPATCNLKPVIIMLKRTLTIIIVTASFIAAHAQPPSPWPGVTQTMKPWTRWWWMGSAVDEKNISSALNTYYRAGIGGVEVVPIYGAIGYESRYLPYLSPGWMKMIDYTVQQATNLNMGVYMSVGTGWPIGGPQVSVTDAATRLIVQTYTLKANETLAGKIVVNDPKQKDVASLSALTAYSNDGKILVITDKVQADGSLQWTPTQGEWTLYAAFVGKTKQAVKRAAPGGQGFTLDHFAKNALPDYLKTFDTAFGNTLHGVKVFYNDSYEVFNADWTPAFFEEFQQRRGYDLRLYIRELSSNTASDTVALVKSDYRETMSDLMREHFAVPLTQWSHSKQALSLNQAHGSPGNLLDLYAAVDIPEAETFGSSHFNIPGLRRDSADVRNVDPDPNMLKFASSAAHATGGKLASCETFTWLGEHFKTAWSQCKPEVEQAFLAGINHVFFHGTTYSPADAPWPGWLFYASVNFVPNNSLWPQLSGLDDYITRCQSILQSGEPDNEILAYWPIYDVWNNSNGMDMPLKVHDINEWLHPTAFYKNLTALQAKGYSVDFASDRMLHEASVTNGSLKVSAKGAAHTVLLVSQCQHMPVATLQDIIRLAKDGATVVLQQWPADVPGLHNMEAERKALRELIASLPMPQTKEGISVITTGKGRIIIAADAQKGLAYAQVQRESLTDSGLKFIRRKTTDGKYYYIVNHTADAVNTTVPIQFAANAVILMDPQTGASGMAAFSKKDNTTEVRLQLQPGEAIILKAINDKPAIAPWKYLGQPGTAIALNGQWKVHFTNGGPFIPADITMPTLQPWTMFTNDSTTQSFSGTGIYTTTFNLPAKSNGEYLLQLGKVYESAKVSINGKEVGILWSIPFQARVGKFLKEGENTITIEVANLMANRIHYMDKNGIPWRKYHEINFVNINYQNFDASHWKIQPSGLEGPVTITPEQ